MANIFFIIILGSRNFDCSDTTPLVAFAISSRQLVARTIVSICKSLTACSIESLHLFDSYRVFPQLLRFKPSSIFVDVFVQNRLAIILVFLIIFAD